MKFYGTWLWKSMNMHICECNTSAILVDCSDACLPFCVILSYICKRSEWVWQNRTNSLLLMSWLSSPTAARKKKIWIPHKIMVNRTTCRKLSPNIWKTLIIMIINGNKENTLSKVIYKLFQVFCYIFLKIIYSAFTNLYLLCVRNRTSGPLAWTVRTHTLWQELSPPPAMY